MIIFNVPIIRNYTTSHNQGVVQFKQVVESMLK